MNDLLANIIDAHRKMDRWNGYEKVDATIMSGRGFFPLKGVLQDSAPRRMTVWLHRGNSGGRGPLQGSIAGNSHGVLVNLKTPL